MTKWQLCKLRQFCACFQHGDACKGSSSFRAIALNSSDSLHRNVLILCLHHKQLKISFFFTDFYFAGGGGGAGVVSNMPCLLPILVLLKTSIVVRTASATPVLLIKVGYKGVYIMITRTCFSDVKLVLQNNYRL